MTTEVRAYQRCVRTIMDTTDPDIWFDERGVSSHALNFDKVFSPILTRAQAGERLAEFDAIVEQIKADGKGKPYDVVMGVSGGVDSTYNVLQAVKRGLRPLLVHFDSGWNSELAVANIHNMVEKLGLDLYTHVIDWREMRDLQLSFFKASLANCDIPTDHAFAWVAYDRAKKYGIKWIFTGSNYASESILPTAWGYDAADSRHVKGVQKRFGTVRLRTYPLMGQIRRRIWYPYVLGIHRIDPLNYIPYIYPEAKREITEELGWRDYGGKHYESVFTRYFQGYYLPHKFGYDKRLAHYSSLILAGQLTRDTALEMMESTNYPEELRKQDHEFIAKKLGVTVDELEAIFAQPPVDYTAYPNFEKQMRVIDHVFGWILNLAWRLGVRRRR